MAKQSAPARSARPPVLVADLMGAAREITLIHDGAEYRLRITANGKLILTK